MLTQSEIDADNALHIAEAFRIAKMRRQLSDKLPWATSSSDSRLEDIHTLDQQVRDLCKCAGIHENYIWQNI